jgi:DNA-binding transcriptional MerR regulator
MTEDLWTLAELADRVAAALSSGYDGQQNRRVTDVPDTRSIRYYTTIGLLDRAAAMRGRTALYGRRHLWQLVAIKRLQADGRSLADIQAELAAAPDRTLQRIAALPDAPFWKTPPAPTDPTPLGQTPLEKQTGVYQTVVLDDGTMLLIPRRDSLDDREIADIRAAAQPLTTTLRRIVRGNS